MADVFDHKKWLSSLKTKFNIPDTEIPREAEEGWMRQNDYDSNFNKLKSEHAKRMAVEDQFHQDLVASQQKLQLVADLEAKFGPAERWSDSLAAAIAGAHPELVEDQQNSNSGLDPRTVQQMISDAISQTEQRLAAQVNNVGKGAAIMIDFMATAPERWRDTYGVKFPKDEFSQFFAKSGIQDPHVAFEIFEKPYKEKKLEDEYKAKLDEAEKKGYQSAMSKHGIVDTPSNTPQSSAMFSSREFDPATGQPKAPAENAPTHEAQRAKVGSAYQRALDAANSGKIPGSTPGQ